METKISPQQVNQTPVSPNPPLVSHSPKSKLPIIIGGILVLLLTSSGSYYFGTQQETSTSQQIDPTPSQSHSQTVPSVTSDQPGSISYTSKELPITFSYPTELGELEESVPHQENKENRWAISFTDGEPNYASNAGEYTLSANTIKFVPISHEGSPDWINAEVTETDTEATIKQKLLKAEYDVLDVKKVQNTKGITAFRVWLLHCYFSGCLLASDYVIPFNYKGYVNLQIYGIVSNLNVASDPSDNSDKSVATARKLAEKKLTEIRENTLDANTKKYIDIHDSLFNSLVIGQ